MSIDNAVLADIESRVASEVSDVPANDSEVKEQPKKEAKQEAPDDVQVEQVEQVQADPDVERATKGGWQPKEAWIAAGKDPDEWVSAKRFNKNGELFDSIHQLKSKTSEQEKLLKAMADHNKKIAEKLTQRQKDEILAKRDAAIELGDKEAVREYDKQLGKAEEDLKPAQTQVEPPVPRDAQEWIESREWLKDPELREVAAALHQKQLDKKDSRSLPEMYEEVERRIKAAYPEKFPKAVEKVQETERRLSSVEAPATVRQVAAKREKGWTEIPEEHRKVGNDFVRRGLMSRDEYAKQYWSLNS